MRRPVTLTARLVVVAVALVVVAAVLIGLVAALGTRSFLVARVDADLAGSLTRLGPAAEAPGPGRGPGSGPGSGGDGSANGSGSGGAGPDDLRALGVGGVSASWPAISDGASDESDTGASAGSGVVLAVEDQQVASQPLEAAQLDALRELSTRGGPHDVDLPGLGRYRAAVATTPDESTVVATALPLDDVDSVVRRLVGLEALLTALVALAALGVGTVLVRRELRPLREVARTARTVAALPLAAGEIALDQRVPAHLSDEQSEVGRVGSALNTLLAHVEDSLAVRQRSEQQVRQFVADASHELRTPLATIAGYTELARRRPDDVGAVRTALGKVEDETGRMTALVEDLLLLARLDSGRPLEQRPVDLSRLLLEAVADAQVVAPEHRWRLRLPEEPVEVLGDERRLHQVVTNLLTNARKYTPPGTTVVVSAGDGGFAVEDDGPGFAPEVVDRAFERFVRADPARHREQSGPAGTTSSPGGVGLGLSLVRAVVTAHAGSVSLRSVPGATRLEVALPTTPLSTTPPSTTPPDQDG